MKKLYGVITAMTTPFNAENNVDYDALAQQCEFLISKGVNCLYPTGTTGEMYLCSIEERKKIAETVVKTAAGRVTVYIHVGAMKQEETIELAQHAENIGADGIGVVTPSYFNVNDRAMAQYFITVCNSVSKNFPVYAYAIPQLAKNELTCEVLEEVKKCCENLVGVKYSFGDMSQVLRYKRVNGGDFSVVLGADQLFLPGLSIGCDGTVSGCSGPFPEPFVNVYKHYQQDNIEEARKAQDIANDLVWLMKGGSDMSIFKNVLKLRGVEGGHVRAPLLDLTKEQVEALTTEVLPYIEMMK